MKFLFFVTFVTFVTFCSIPARAEKEYSPLSGQLQHPIRAIDGKTINLAPLITWINARAYLNPRNQQPLPAWTAYTQCEILYQGKGYLLLTEHIWNGNAWAERPQPIVLKNYPHKYPDGKRIAFLAIDAGIQTVHDRFGVPHQYKAYDYGTPLDQDQTRDYLATIAAARTNAISARTNLVLSPQSSQLSSTNKPKLQIKLAP